MLLKYKNLIWFFVVIIVLNCCSENRNRKKIAQWIGKEIVLNDTLKAYSINEEKPLQLYKNKKYTIVCHVNHDCNNCLEDLIEWKQIINKIENQNVSFHFYVEAPDWKHIKNYLKAWEFDSPVIVDSNYWLRKNNVLPEEVFLNTFLLNHENRIVLIGNPTKNIQLQNLYMETINK